MQLVVDLPPLAVRHLLEMRDDGAFGSSSTDQIITSCILREHARIQQQKNALNQIKDAGPFPDLGFVP